MGIEHGLKQIVAQIVVLAGDLTGAAARLQVKQAGADGIDQIVEVAGQLLVQAVAQGAVKKHIQTLAVPPAVHIALAQPQGAGLEHGGEQLRVMDLQVIGLLPLKANAGLLQ